MAAPRQAALLHCELLPSWPPFPECFRELQVQGLQKATAKRVENLEEHQQKITRSLF